MSWEEYVKFLRRGESHKKGNGKNKELKHKLGKLTVAFFDGSEKISARAWLQKLETYFVLNPMKEKDAVQFATLHLEGEAYEWWYHGHTTLGSSLGMNKGLFVAPEF